MKFTIKNFRGVGDAVLDFANHCLIVGTNHVGKTSILQGISALLTGNHTIYEDVKKNEISLLIHSGSAGAEITYENGEDNFASLTYPKLLSKSVGAIPSASEYSCGLKSFVGIPTAYRAKLLMELTKTEPTKEQLAKAIGVKFSATTTPRHGGQSQEISEEEKELNAIWSTIQQLGWDAAHAAKIRDGAKLKSDWGKLTGETYGSKKAADWRPASWSDDLDEIGREKLASEFDVMSEFLKAAEINGAIGAVQAGELKVKSETLPTLQKDLADLEIQLIALKNHRDELQNKLPSGTVLTCPECGSHLVFKPSGLVKSEKLKATDLEARRKEIYGAQASISAHEAEKGRLQSQIADAESASAKLTNAKIGDDDVKILEMRDKVEHASERLLAFDLKNNALKIHDKCIYTGKIVNALAPEGLRLVALKSGIEMFNTALRRICSFGEWPMVSVSNDLSVKYNNTPYVLASTSEQFIVRCALQLAVSLFEKTDIVMIDGADVLDNFGRNGLINLMYEYGDTAGKIFIVNMTFSRKKNDDGTFGELITPDFSNFPEISVIEIDDGETK